MNETLFAFGIIVLCLFILDIDVDTLEELPLQLALFLGGIICMGLAFLC